MKNSAEQITKDEKQFKGTKGEWLIDPLNTISIIDSSGDLMSQLICQINGKWDKEEKKANAILISKAPEMLEMISELLKELEFHGYRHSTTIYNAQNLINEATEIK